MTLNMRMQYICYSQMNPNDARRISEIIRPPEPAIRFASTLLGSCHFPGGCKARGTWQTCSLGWRKLQLLGSCEKPSLGAAACRHRRTTLAEHPTRRAAPGRSVQQPPLDATTGCFWLCPSVSYQFRVSTYCYHQHHQLSGPLALLNLFCRSSSSIRASSK